MKTITLSDVSESLYEKLLVRAKSHQRTVAEEAALCLEESVEADAALLEAIPAERWAQIEESLIGAMNEPSTELTEKDFARYRDLARGHEAR